VWPTFRGSVRTGLRATEHHRQQPSTIASYS
jgi:hypothetical protein